ncbi:glycosyl transferase [Longispora fulva]|uniref:MGT family glycosyltransferase n=1 Tax=Longispora fulva TaxID=619741 RepID=A0A8J7GQQ8_9ACTN|nr:glycosyltransferase [Longispora fulva]MBG6136378.1 MGT family glycosyltransferase [Longispora fulva]GIG63449.1 glycosyl transferase [Longispora fulva]
MSRYLLVVPPLTGHLAPLLAVAATLSDRGHQIGWAGAETWLRSFVEPDQLVYDCAVDTFARTDSRPPTLQGAAALKFLVQDYLVPLAEAMLPGTLAAIGQFRPDVVIADQQAFAGVLAADRLAITCATSASTSAELATPFTPAIHQWVRDQLRALSARSGSRVHDPRFSDRLTLAFTTRALFGHATVDETSVRFVGPAIGGCPPAAWRPPWPDDDPRPTVLVTLGTVNTHAGTRFLTACATALARRDDLRAIIVDPAGDLGPQPDTIAVARHLPQLAALAHVDTVICHAGHNTVCETLWHGLPLVVAPIRDDQPIIAEQVTTAGAGIRLRFGRASSDDITRAVDQVLTEPAYRTAAHRIKDSFHGAGGALAAAGHLEDLAGRE